MEKKEEEFSLTQMRKSVEKLGYSTEMFGERTLMRFLIARSMNPEKAAKMFVEWKKWRAAMVPNGFISESEVPDELETRKIYLQGLSKDKCPVLIVKASKHFPSKDQLQFKKFVVHLLDKTIASILHIRTLTARGLITGFQFLQAYYPERLARCYILNMPRFFVSVWRMVSYFLEKATLEKIVIVSNDDERREFIKEVGEETLPEEYGGRSKLVAIQDVVLTSLES
ncbi:CRAL-TRIO domain-containing protein [Quillaja saponaria]|uniref:CRAL-TRIO domain-containing protein n=1 Tax=Quillaja saponaria TaxID=32244 RepID=A0AAD7LA08_QUISA|nr:CRAL-TRIO domain-containing protein [Quillaja saponaria]